jgi:tetratricopeptide (TPR) repeat protein
MLGILRGSIRLTEVMRSPNSDDDLRKKLTNAEAEENIPECIRICRRALAEASNSDPDYELHFGLKLAAFLLAYKDSATVTDLDEAIRVMRQLLQATSRQDKPKTWALLNLQLGGAIGMRKGDLNEAIRYYEKALEVFTREKDAKEWALAKVAAGEAYYRLAGDDSIADLCKSLEYHREALTVFTPELYPNEGLIETIDMIEDVVAKARERRAGGGSR